MQPHAARLRPRIFRILICTLSVAALTFLSTTLFVPQRAAHAASSGFVYRCGIHFCLNGNYYYFAGTNTYDMFTYGDGSSTATQDQIENNFMNKAEIDSHMAALESDHVSVLRLWMFNHQTWHGFESSKGVYNEPEFEEFDYIIQSAIAHNIKLLPTLENYWPDYGGIDQRLAWEGLPTGDANRWVFFNQAKCPGCFTQYENYVNYVLNHVNHYSGVAYKNEPAIFAWELMNEPRYQNATPNENTTGTTLRAWVDTMGAYIKSIDPNHMLDAGLEGHQSSYGFGGDEGNPFVYIQESPYIDFTSAHPYPTESWANLTLAQTEALIDKWVSDSHNIVGKPFFMGEFNVLSYVVGSNRPAWWNGMMGEIEKDGGDGDAFWWYETNGNDPNYGVVQGAPELAVFDQHSLNMQAKNVPYNGTPNPTPTATSAPTVTPTSVPTATPTSVPTATPTSMPTATPTHTAGTSCSVHYAVTNQWQGGFGASFTLANTGTTAINGWSLQFSFANGQTITQLWNGTFTQSGSAVTITNVSYNGSIPAGGVVSSEPGFNGSWNSTNAPPTAFTLNGTACSVV